MQQSVNSLALAAKADERRREELIKSHEQTILRTACSVCGRYVTRSDDEWSVALYAFSRAVDRYDTGRGDFLPFARMLIRRALVDSYRSGKGGLLEFPVAPHVLEGNAGPEEDPEGVYLAVAKASRERSDRGLRDEILEAGEAVQAYGFRFFDLTSCSPRQEKTRRDCAAAVRVLLDRPELMAEMEKTRRLPAGPVCAASGVSRKTLDRYRKYIIFAAVVLSGDYPHLAEYLKFVREGRKV